MDDTSDCTSVKGNIFLNEEIMLHYFSTKTGSKLKIKSTSVVKNVVQYELYDGAVLNQNEVLTTRFYNDTLRIQNNKYSEAWQYSVQYCRKYNICTSKKWLPWEKKFFFSIYHLTLNREYL